MSNHKMRTHALAAFAALTLGPALALAQSGSPAGSNTGTGSSQGSATQAGSNQGSSNQGAPAAPVEDDQDSAAHPGHGTESGSMQQGQRSTSMMGSESQASSGASANRAQQSIDPSQIQQVFGTDAAVVDLSSLDADDVRQLQTTLQERGHYRGNVDGIVGPQTRAALNAVLAEQYALNQRLINQGQVTEQLVSSLGVDAQGIAPVSGVDDPMDAERQPAQRPSQPRNSGTSSSPGSSQPSGFSSSSPSGSSGANGSSGAPSPTSPPPAPR